MDELISRQASIDALYHVDEYNGRSVEAIRNLPSAEPKRGKWILDRSGAYCCSECMEPCATYVLMKPRDKFCKMCGAKMEVNRNDYLRISGNRKVNDGKTFAMGRFGKYAV